MQKNVFVIFAIFVVSVMILLSAIAALIKESKNPQESNRDVKCIYGVQYFMYGNRIQDSKNQQRNSTGRTL